MNEAEFFRGVKEYVFFEKIKKQRKKQLDYFEDKYESQLNEQVIGSGHLIADRIVRFDSMQRDDYKNSPRPGIVCEPPSKTTNFETEWAPGTSKTESRPEKTTIIFSAEKSGVERDTAFLLNYRRYYKCTSLSERKFKLTSELQRELELKLSVEEM